MNREVQFGNDPNVKETWSKWFQPDAGYFEEPEHSQTTDDLYQCI